MCGRASQHQVVIDPNFKTTLYYNIATCYHKLDMLEECVDHLELATKHLNLKITLIEDEESAMSSAQGFQLKRDRLLGFKLQKLRYQCKLNLQMCAILSQLDQHGEALSYA